jgi:hypothetical protein
LVKNNFIEIIYVEQDMKEFNKYYYIPDKYKKYIIITSNDNFIFEKESIENLYKSYLSNPNCISARRVFKMRYYDNWILKPFYSWNQDYNLEKNPKFSLFAIHGDGVLFPPKSLNITDDFIYCFKKIIYAHDFIIKYYELKENLKTVYVYNKNNYQNYSYIDKKLYEKFNQILIISPKENQLAEDFKKSFNLSTYNNIIKEKVSIPNEIKNVYFIKKNNNSITNETLLISMTSYPPRIYGIYDVFISLLSQTADISSYQCFLTLSKEEFINGEKDLPVEMQKLISIL